MQGIVIVQRDCRGRLPLVYTQSQIAATVIKLTNMKAILERQTDREIRELSEYPTLEEIKAIYKRLVKQYHPDVNKATEATEYMKRINRAYAIATGKEKVQQPMPPPPPP